MRIFIDCTRADLARPMTGIANVTLNYVAGARAWSRESGIEIIPVIVGADGLVAIPQIDGGTGASGSAQTVMRPDAIPLGVRLAHLGRHYTKDIVHHALMLVASVFRFRRVRDWARRGSEAYAALAARPEAFLSRRHASRSCIEPAPGDALFSPAYWHDLDPAFYQRLAAKGVAIFPLVHDLLPITHPGYYQSPWCDTFRSHVVAALSYARAFFCVSARTRDSLLAFAAALGKPCPPIYVAHNGLKAFPSPPEAAFLADALAEARALVERHGPPLLMVGTIEPKKGHLDVLETLEAKWRQGYARPLLLVGQTGWMCDAIVQRITRSSYYGDRLVWIPGLDAASLGDCYRQCHALIFASIAEGFGLPMIEAAALRKPVIVRDIAVAHEILGDLGAYFDDRAGLSTAIDRLEQPAAYGAVCDKLAAFSWPGWSERSADVFGRIVELAGVPDPQGAA